jgi:hypothetical protein
MTEGEWIHMKIVVERKKAALYLGESTQPCLLINDLKLGDTQGAIAYGVDPAPLAISPSSRYSKASETADEGNFS